MSMLRHTISTLVLVGALAAIPLSRAPAATFLAEDIIFQETFTDAAGGWGDRDSGKMTVTLDSGNDWMVGQFGGQAFPTPQTDAFRISSGPNFTGNFTGLGITGLSFDFYSANVLPSDLIIRLISGSGVFTYQFTPTGIQMWQTFSVEMLWSYGWDGAGESAFNLGLTAVNAVEIQLTRRGTGAQSYYLDNVTTYNTPLSWDTIAVPEPDTLGLFIVAAVVVLRNRRKFFRGNAYDNE